MRRRLWAVVRMFNPPEGRGARRLLAGIMLIMAGGRFGWYSSNPLTQLLKDWEYGVLLTVFGLALYPNGYFRLSKGGRFVAALGALLFATMAWDVPTWGVTKLLYGFFAVVLVKETFSSHDC